MDQETKNSLLEKGKKHIKRIQEVANVQIGELKGLIERGNIYVRGLTRGDQLVQSILRSYHERRAEELALLQPSPYFSRCDFIPEGEKEEKTFYFGKFTLPEENIYSWVSPISSLRFENPGMVSYTKKQGSIQNVHLHRKDQYMILNGNINFFSTENITDGKQLIYQEHFSNRKSGFILPEIVAQMEKAQDQVIRADHRGPFVLSGPAGSGKTTLALHRVAYLVQSPETSDLFPPHSIIVFVQDTGTKQYFSKLLPELGIHEVQITTFSEWALKILGAENIQYVIRLGNTEVEKDFYEYEKNKALLDQDLPTYRQSSFFALLENIYTSYFSTASRKLWQEQKKQKVLDRFDLSLLLKMYEKSEGQFSQEKEYYIERKNGNYQKKKGKVPLEYTLAIVDEFQNYLPCQLEIIKSTLLGREKSLVYVGDMAQQVQIGTLKDWSEIHETITPERKVILQKVYRNTKKILEYIYSLGYTVSIPEQIREGVAVQEYMCDTAQEIMKIQKLIERKDRGSIGILAKDMRYLQQFKEKFENEKDVYILTMSEAQGVEFDIVCLVGIDESTFLVDYPHEPALQDEKIKIHRDLLYVALTRAMSELVVFGRLPLREILSPLQNFF